MRAWRAATAATAVLLVGCTAGHGAGDRAEAPPSSSATPTSTPTTAPVGGTSPGGVGGSATATSAPPAAGDPAGSVTLRVSGFTLPAGAGLRVVVRASSPRLTVRRKGAGGPLSACPVADAAGPAAPAGCVDLEAGRDVDLGGGRGVAIEARGGGATVEEVALTYVPADRSMTVVTPARPPASCSATACEATFSMTPARPGAFVLDGRPGGGRPQLTLRSEAGGGASRVLATVEGGGALSITATLEPAAEAVLHYREQLEGAVAP